MAAKKWKVKKPYCPRLNRSEHGVLKHLGDVLDVGEQRFLVKMFPARLGFFLLSLFSIVWKCQDEK